MKKLSLCILLLAATFTATAQEKKEKFSPEKFDAELHQYIKKEAQLNEQELAKFLPVYKEMQTKMRTLYDRQRKLERSKPADEDACAKAIKERDEIEINLKQIEQSYHQKFVKVLSAQKAMSIIKAEKRFHRHKMKQWGERRGNGRGFNKDGKVFEKEGRHMRPEGRPSLKQ